MKATTVVRFLVIVSVMFANWPGPPVLWPGAFFEEGAFLFQTFACLVSVFRRRDSTVVAKRVLWCDVRNGSRVSDMFISRLCIRLCRRSLLARRLLRRNL